MTELAGALGELGIWVRLMYVYPYPHVDEVLPLMAEGRVLPYLDVPLQHASQRVLKQMKRPANTADTLRRIERWRDICPGITIRSTFIVGFPGETDQDFATLLDFLAEAQLDRVGCFKYSPVEGAAANNLAGAVDEEVKQQRLERFMAVQSAISRRKLQGKIGGELTVLVDTIDDEGRIVARSSADAPDIDGVVIADAGDDVDAGEFVQIRITGADEHDLSGEIVG